MLIKELNIEEFRGIKGLIKPLKFSKFNVLVGRNNEGKTSILEALSLFPTSGDGKLPVIDAAMISIIRSQMHIVYLYSGFATLNYWLSTNERYGLSIKENGQINNYYVNSAEEKQETFSAKIMDNLNIPKEDFTNTTLYIPNDTQFLADLGKKISDETNWNKVTKAGANFDFVKKISKTVSDNFTEVFIDRNNMSLRKESQDKPKYIHASDLGSGFMKILYAGLWLECWQPKLILWDDFEASIHPSLITLALQWLLGKDAQVVISTHSMDVLGALTSMEPPDTSVILLRKSQNDVLDYQALSAEECRDMIISSIDPRFAADAMGLSL